MSEVAGRYGCAGRRQVFGESPRVGEVFYLEEFPGVRPANVMVLGVGGGGWNSRG